MGSASRHALTAVRESLSGSLAASVGTELLAASAQIGGAPALQSVLADGSADPEAKTAVVDNLFGSVSGDARGVLVAAVRETWSNSEELVAGIEELGLRAEAMSRPDLTDELLAAASAIDSSHELELSLGDKLGDPAAKAGVVEKLFSGRLSAPAVNVVTHLVANPRGRRLSAALRESARIAADQGGSEIATVTVAAPLSDAQQAKLAELLERSAGRPVRVTTVLDPAVIGGVKVQLGGDVIDGSVRARLDDLRLQLAG